MRRKSYPNIIALVVKASDLAQTIGITNLLQPGLVKEMIIADILGHELIHSKRDADAHAQGDPTRKYEYLSCKEGNRGQLDRMFKSPPEKREESLIRITRNSKIYYAVFYRDNQTKCKAIYELDPEIVLMEAERQLDRSRNEISHVGFGIRWTRENGKIVYEDQST